MTGVLNCISSNSLWELDLLVSCPPSKGREVIQPGVSAGLQKKPGWLRPHQFRLYFPTLIFSGEPARTAPDTNAPSDRLDECELIGLMIFLPHFPPLYGCSMVHGADGWNQLPHTHILPNFNSPRISRTQHTGRKTSTNFCVFISFPRCSRT